MCAWNAKVAMSEEISCIHMNWQHLYIIFVDLVKAIERASMTIFATQFIAFNVQCFNQAIFNPLASLKCSSLGT